MPTLSLYCHTLKRSRGRGRGTLRPGPAASQPSGRGRGPARTAARTTAASSSQPVRQEPSRTAPLPVRSSSSQRAAAPLSQATGVGQQRQKARPGTAAAGVASPAAEGSPARPIVRIKAAPGNRENGIRY